MITEIQPDKQKAKALLKMAETTLERLESTDKEKYPTNTLIDYYDSLHKLMESLTLSEGIKIKGEGAHYLLIEYIAKKHKFQEKERLFLQQIREYKNRISYEGFSVSINYIYQNEDTIKSIKEKLLGLIANLLSQ